MRYYRGHIALSDARDIPILLHLRNARAVCLDQLYELLAFDLLPELPRTLRWRLSRLERVGLIVRMTGCRHLAKPVFGITQTGLAALESRGYSLLSLPSKTETILHPLQAPHALEMVNIRLALARAGILRSWKSDLEIASKNLALESGPVKDFDAVAEIDLGGTCRTVGLEYERSPKAASRYQAIREVLNRDKSTDAVLYIAANDDILYVLAMELRATRRRIGFVLSDAFRRSLLETNTLTNENSAELMPLRKFLVSQ